MDVQALLAPLSEEAPAGVNREEAAGYQSVIVNFHQARTPGQLADAIDWRSVVDDILAEAAETRDAALAAYLACAGARLGDLDLVEGGCALLAGVLEDFWETGFPALDDGFGARRGACEALTKIPDFLNPLKRIDLIESSRYGRFTGDDFVRFARGEAGASDFDDFKEAVEAKGQGEMVALLARFDSIRASIARIDAVLGDKANGAPCPDFALTFEVIDDIREALAPYAQAVPEPSGEEGDGKGAPAEPFVAAPSARRSGGAGIPAKLETRVDVLKAIDAVIDYYHRHEPGSAVSAVLSRARGWVGLDFMSILRDIAPDSISDFENVLIARGDRKKEDE